MNIFRIQGFSIEYSRIRKKRRTDWLSDWESDWLSRGWLITMTPTALTTRTLEDCNEKVNFPIGIATKANRYDELNEGQTARKPGCIKP